MDIKGGQKFFRSWLDILFALVILGGASTALAQGSIISRVSFGANVTRYAPNETLPVTVVLSNFGASKRVDVTVTYSILDAGGRTVASQEETVAVETTDSFVKQVQIPADIPSGEYTLSSSVFYIGQAAPATSSFKFKIEPKFAGIFVSDLIVYGLILLALFAISAAIGRWYSKKRVSRLAPIDYNKTPARERIFYEMTSDIIGQMRSQIGSRALELAGEIQGLTVDKQTGRILKMTKDPAEVVALLIYKYEKFVGKKIFVTPHPVAKNMTGVLRPVNQNLKIIEKYFKRNHE